LALVQARRKSLIEAHEPAPRDVAIRPDLGSERRLDTAQTGARRDDLAVDVVGDRYPVRLPQNGARIGAHNQFIDRKAAGVFVFPCTQNNAAAGKKPPDRRHGFTRLRARGMTHRPWNTNPDTVSTSLSQAVILGRADGAA
jgi:hypothetical protein